MRRGKSTLIDVDNIYLYLKNNKFQEVADFPWYYIDRNANIISLNWYPIWLRKPTLMNATCDIHWYNRVNLYKDWKQYTKKVHRIMAITFLDKLEWKNYVNHIDHNKANNKLENLEWCTIKENNIHCRTNPKRNVWRAQLWKWNEMHHNSKKIIQYDKDMNLMRIYPCIREANKQTWINGSSIGQCARWNKKWSHAWWFIWRFYDEDNSSHIPKSLKEEYLS